MFHKGYAYGTASTYISAIRYQHRILNLKDYSSEFTVSKMLESYQRSRSLQDSRLPITYDIFIKICYELNSVCNSQYESILFKAAYTLAFFGLFRVGELVYSMGTDPLKLSDIQNFKKGKQFQVCLRHSKNNHCGLPQFIDIAAISSEVCPVNAMLEYLHVRPSNAVHNLLYCHQDASPLTRYQSGAVLNKVIVKLNLNTSYYKSHSFQIGAATWLAQGVSRDTIKKMGRWTSDSFKKYIR